jgi:hypothetical protein
MAEPERPTKKAHRMLRHVVDERFPYRHQWRRATVPLTRSVWIVGTGVVAALVAAGCVTTTSSTPPTTTIPSAATGTRTLGARPLGVNAAAWDPLYTGTSGTSIGGILEKAGVRQVRFPGGDFADQYDWSSNTDSVNCPGVVTATCPRNDPLGFDPFEAQAHSIGASTFVTVNYGSGTPAEAAEWVSHARSVPNDSVGMWEVGNESYSCYETNQHLAGSPTYVEGYSPGGSECPATKVMAHSYAIDALPYIQAMKQADPDVRIGIPWAFSGAVAKGAGVQKADTWNAAVLHALGRHISFVDAHWYPFDDLQGISDQQIVMSVRRIPSAAGHIISTLHRYAPTAGFTVGETNISERPTTDNFQPVSALFAAATSLEWLSAGAESVDWWDINNDGSPTSGDFGLVSSGSPETVPAGSPYPPAYGEALASMLATPGSRLRSIPISSSSVLGFESSLHGDHKVLLVNASPESRDVSSTAWFKSGSHIQTQTYGPSTVTRNEPIVTATASSTTRMALPAESIVVLSSVTS